MIFEPNLMVHVVEPAGVKEDLFSYVTHHVGRYNYTLMTSLTSTVYQAHFSGVLPFYGQVKKLTFFQLGTEETPDMSVYASSCKSVVFKGHICNVHTAMKIVSQLPNVKKVTFYVGRPQRGDYVEPYEEFFHLTPYCPHVEKLKICMDLDYFYCFSVDDIKPNQLNPWKMNITQRCMIILTECLLKHSMDSFPNLNDLKVNLLDYETLYHGLQNLIRAIPGLGSNINVKSVTSPAIALPVSPQTSSSGYCGSRDMDDDGSSVYGAGNMEAGSGSGSDSDSSYPFSPFQPMTMNNSGTDPWLSSPCSGPCCRQGFIQPPLDTPSSGLIPSPQDQSTEEGGDKSLSPAAKSEAIQRVNDWLSSLNSVLV